MLYLPNNTSLINLTINHLITDHHYEHCRDPNLLSSSNLLVELLMIPNFNPAKKEKNKKQKRDADFVSPDFLLGLETFFFIPIYPFIQNP